MKPGNEEQGHGKERGFTTWDILKWFSSEAQC